MGASNRSFLSLFLGIALVFVAVGGGLAYAVHSAGMIDVEVHSRGGDNVDISLHVPAALGHLALAFVPASVFDDCCEEGDWERWVPLITEACDRLSDCPDFVLVEVISDEDHVVVRKESRALVVDVTDGVDRVHVRVPLGIAEAFARKVERLAGAYS
jgi:hypothetical protein